MGGTRCRAFRQRSALRTVRQALRSAQSGCRLRESAGEGHEGFRRQACRRHGRRHGHGTRARPPARRRGLPRRDVRRLGGAHGRDRSALRPRTARRRAPASPRMSPTSPTRPRCCASATRSRSEHATDKVHLLFNNAGIGGGGSLFTNTPRAVGADLRHLLGRRLPLHARVPADADEGGRRRTSSTPAASTASGRRSGRACRTPPTARPSSR